MKYLVSSMIIGLLVLFTMGCNGVKHVLQIEEPTDHTQGDDGGKLKYKIIWGDINQKEWSIIHTTLKSWVCSYLLRYT